MKSVKLYIYLIFLIIPFVGKSITIDSMIYTLSQKKGEEQYVLLTKYLDKTPRDSLEIKEKLIRYTLKQIKNTNESIYKGRVYLKLADVLSNQNKLKKALDTIFIAKYIIELNNDSLGKGDYYSIMGMYYYKSQNHDLALIFHDSALHLYKQLNSLEKMAYTNANIGRSYFMKHDYYNSIAFVKKAEEIYTTVNNKRKLYSINGLLSMIYKNAQMMDEAVKYLEKQLKLEKELNIILPKIALYNRSGLYYRLGKKKKAYDIMLSLYNNTCFSLIGDKKMNTNLLRNIQSKFNNDDIEFLSYASRTLAHYKHNLGKRDSVYHFMEIAYWAAVYSKNFEIKQSGGNVSLHKEKFKLEKKQLESQLALSKERENNYRQRLLLFIIIGIVIIIGYSLIIFRRSNKKLQEKNSLIKKQQGNIIDSINYASRIQHSIMMPEKNIRKTLPGFFAYFNPRDIVSGDFYWYGVVGDVSIIAAIDCTGHGVPGAFMSMIGNTLLNEIVIEKKILDPGDILNHLHESVIINLQQDKEGDHAQDGMDVSLCTINSKNKEIKFAGAKNPLYYVKDNKVESIKGDPFSIGGMYRYSKKTKKEIKFNTKLIYPAQNLSLYLFSDGYMDQFGSNNKIAFNTKRFKNLLLEIHDKGPDDQKKSISDKMIQWIGNTKQLDDMLVVGFKM